MTEQIIVEENEIETIEAATPLALLDNKTAAQLYVEKGVDPILQKLEKMVAEFVGDISTEEGRKSIKSFAYSIAQTKTKFDKLGMALTEGWREQTKDVNKERTRIETRLQELQDQVKAPLVEFEEREKKRVKGFEDHIALFYLCAKFEPEETAAQIQSRIYELEAKITDDEKWSMDTWNEFNQRAETAYKSAMYDLTVQHKKKVDEEALAAEQEQARIVEEARLQKEREDKIASDAADKARKDAEAAAERLRVEAAAKVEQERAAEAARVKQREADAEAEKKRLEKEKQAAIDAAKKAEDDRVALEKKTEQARKDAEAAATRRADKAAADERQKIADQQAAEKKAADDREADKNHRKKINNSAVNGIIDNIDKSIVELGGVEEYARAVISVIAKGLVPNVSIKY